MPKNNHSLILRYPLNLEMITERLTELQESLEKLRALQKTSRGKFLAKGSDEQYIMRAALHIVLQALLDVALHLSTRIPGLPVRAEPYRETIKKLSEAGVISSEFLSIAEKMANYRNRLVHFYLEITPDELYDILTNHLEDIAEFKRQLAKFVDEHRDDQKFTMTE